MNKKDNQRVKLTRKLLSDSLIKLLKEKNIYEISVKEICECAEINRSTFYKYYDSQYALLDEMEKEVLEYINETFDKDINLIQSVLNYLYKNKEFCILLLNNNLDAEFPKNFLSNPLFHNAIRDRLKNKYNDTEIDYITTYIFLGTYHIVKKWLNNNCVETPEEITKIINKLIAKTSS